MTKPRGSLGVLEDVAAHLAGIAGSCPAPLPTPAKVAVFAGDHGVHAAGVTPWPQEVTAQMVANFLGGGAVVNAFARGGRCHGGRRRRGRRRTARPGRRAAGPQDPAWHRRPRSGPAMTVEQARRAVEAGIEVATSLAPGSGSLITGDIGIANTTASAPPPARRSCSTAIAGSAALVAAALCPPALEYALAHLGLRPLLGLDLLSSFRRHLRTTTNAPRTPRGRSSCTAASASKSSD